MGREERKLRKHYDERAKRERKLARKHSQTEQAEETGVGIEATVVGIGPGCCEVLENDRRFLCRTTLDVAVGDAIVYSPERQKILRVLPRRTVLSRPDPHNPRIERVIAANIDVVVVVVSLKSPPLRPGLIDRYFIAIERSGAAGILCVNKTDLIDDEAGMPTELDPYRELGMQVFFCSAVTGAGIEQLAAELAGKTCVFTGHSGVGKSSLLNAMSPGLQLDTGDVSEIHNKGRHTTTTATRHMLPGGAIVIDTPGIREFGLWQITPATLRDYFPEMRDLGQLCKYRDCSHTEEPGCGVKEAVGSDRMRAARYSAYLRLLNALRANPTIY
ncbi:MAG: ribosome biosis GTPase / thiamine phosphate phosphatase [Gammaproteobacteria bacterium]|nr:ribosome biosis GTPase / thiamine phosphate phosphatase [Gammaproteobacteria bacterium]